MTAPVSSQSTGEFVGAPFGTEIEYRAALREAMRAEMQSDPGVILIGDEVARYGGAYAVSKGMLEEFGEARIIDTPISEPAIVGSAVGAAMTGLKPIAELMYVDFGYLAMDQIANQAAILEAVGMLKPGDLANLDKNASNEMDRAVEFAQSSASPQHESMFEDVFDAAQPKPVTVDSRLDSILGSAQ